MIPPGFKTIALHEGELATADIHGLLWGLSILIVVLAILSYVSLSIKMKRALRTGANVL